MFSQHSFEIQRNKEWLFDCSGTRNNITKLYMVPIFSCYPSGTILLKTKAICWERMRTFISVNKMLDKRYISYTITHER